MQVPKIANLISIGGAAQLVGATVDEIDQAADELSIQAVVALHGVPYVDEISFDRIKEHIEQKRAAAGAASAGMGLRN